MTATSLFLIIAMPICEMMTILSALPVGRVSESAFPLLRSDLVISDSTEQPSWFQDKVETCENSSEQLDKPVVDHLEWDQDESGTCFLSTLQHMELAETSSNSTTCDSGKSSSRSNWTSLSDLFSRLCPQVSTNMLSTASFGSEGLALESAAAPLDDAFSYIAFDLNLTWEYNNNSLAYDEERDDRVIISQNDLDSNSPRSRSPTSNLHTHHILVE